MIQVTLRHLNKKKEIPFILINFKITTDEFQLRFSTNNGSADFFISKLYSNIISL